MQSKRKLEFTDDLPALAQKALRLEDECAALFDGPVFVAKRGTVGHLAWVFCNTSEQVAAFIERGEIVLVTPSRFNCELPVQETRWTVAGTKMCAQVFHLTRDDTYHVTSYLGGKLDLAALDFDYTDSSAQVVAYRSYGRVFCAPLDLALVALRKVDDESESESEDDDGISNSKHIKILYENKELEMGLEIASISMIKPGQTPLAAVAAHVLPACVIFV